VRPGRTIRRLGRDALQRAYGFDRWHVGHGGEQYAADIVRTLNAWPEADRQAAVEIGCGLGDIIRRLHFQQRLGLDRDPRVLRAARLLSAFQGGGRTRFEVFEFPSARLSGVYDAIVMVNWIHAIDPERLRQSLWLYCAQHLRPGGAVVLDTVEDRAYGYNHDVHRLAPVGASIDHLGQYPRGRHVWVVR
jgi:2-polyprenyl-3-methyl-5-hydroxy-6-metoxy-1,4-benzoquinol methylase